MITALDHVVLLCRDLAVATESCARLFGRQPHTVSEDADTGLASAFFATRNAGLELVAPAGEGPGAARVRELLADGRRLTSLALRSDDIAADRRSCARRGLSPGEITETRIVDRASKAATDWRRFRLDDAALHGVKGFVIDAPARTTAPAGAGDVARLDHVVVDTPDPTRAAATYGARLGLRLALERHAPQWNVHFLFFRVGGVTLEVIRRLDADPPAGGEDRLWGLTWAVDDIHAAHQRLAAAGLNLSEVRTGRKPGTEVFTVRDGTLGVPTLFIGEAAR